MSRNGFTEEQRMFDGVGGEIIPMALALYARPGRTPIDVTAELIKLQVDVDAENRARLALDPDGGRPPGSIDTDGTADRIIALLLDLGWTAPVLP